MPTITECQHAHNHRWMPVCPWLWDHSSKGGRYRSCGQQYSHKCTTELSQPAVGPWYLTCLAPKIRLNARPKDFHQKGSQCKDDVGVSIAALSRQGSARNAPVAARRGSQWTMVHHTMCYYGATIKNEVEGWKDSSVAKNVYGFSRRPDFHSKNPDQAAHKWL